MRLTTRILATALSWGLQRGDRGQREPHQRWGCLSVQPNGDFGRARCSSPPPACNSTQPAPCPALPSTAHPRGCAHEHLPCSTACRNHSSLRPSSCCLSVSCQSMLGQCRIGFLFLKHRIIILTLSPHTYQQGVPPPALTHLTQQLLKRRAHIARGLSTTTGLSVSAYFNPSICKLQHFWSRHITLLAFSTQQTIHTAWEKPPHSTLHRKTHKAIPRVSPASLSPSQLHPTQSSWNTN